MSGMLGNIQEIADQTDLLALNAAIEAGNEPERLGEVLRWQTVRRFSRSSSEPNTGIKEKAKP